MPGWLQLPIRFTVAFLVLASCLAFGDLDGDQAPGWREFDRGSSAFVGDRSSIGQDADGDGVFDDKEQPGHEGLGNIWIEFVLVGHDVPSYRLDDVAEIVAEELRLLEMHLEVDVTSSNVTHWEAADFSPEAVSQSRQLDNPHVRLAIVASSVDSPEGAGLAARARGHAMIFDKDDLLGPFPDHGARLLMHELGHNLGLCHPHEPACLSAIPPGQRPAALQSVMHYEADAERPWSWAPVQLDQMRARLACMSQQIRSLGEDPSRDRLAAVRGFSDEPLQPCPDALGFGQRLAVLVEGVGPMWPVAAVAFFLAVAVVPLPIGRLATGARPLEARRPPRNLDEPPAGTRR